MLSSTLLFCILLTAEILPELRDPDLPGCDLLDVQILLLLQVAQLPHFVYLLAHFPFLLFDCLDFACELILGVCELISFLHLGIHELVYFCHEVDAGHSVLLENVLNHE